MDTITEQPHNNEAELTALAMMMQGREPYDTITAKLKATDFYAPEHANMFTALTDAGHDLDTIDPTSIATRLATMGKLGLFGGLDGLARLASQSITTANAGYYVDAIRKETKRRRVIQVGQQLEQMGSIPDSDLSEVSGLLMEVALGVGEEETDDEPRPAYEAVDDMLAHLDELQQNPQADDGVYTGFRCIDEVTHGLRPGQMIVVAGRPAMGKSTLGMDFARAAAIRQNLPVVVFSLEMGEQELAQRIVSAETGIPLSVLADPQRMGKEYWRKADYALGRLKANPNFLLADMAGASLARISAQCRKLDRNLRAKTGRGLGLIVVDYLQLMTSGVREESRQQEVSKFSRGMKMLAKELGCPVVVLSQLNRGSEMRADKKPMMSDLRESGAIEQDADVIFLVHRPDVYDADDRPGEADVMLVKHRNGPTATFRLAFCGEMSCFREMAADGLDATRQ